MHLEFTIGLCGATNSRTEFLLSSYGRAGIAYQQDYVTNSPLLKNMRPRMQALVRTRHVGARPEGRAEKLPLTVKFIQKRVS